MAPQPLVCSETWSAQELASGEMVKELAEEAERGFWLRLRRTDRRWRGGPSDTLGVSRG